jgi:polyhydroxyalkanoate synthesis regulator protein
MHTFIKYPNRKIYCTVESRYVNLKDLLKLVKSGENIEIRCNITKNDLTAEVLASALGKLKFSPEAVIAIIQAAA